jgi:hypothetical protein
MRPRERATAARPVPGALPVYAAGALFPKEEAKMKTRSAQPAARGALRRAVAMLLIGLLAISWLPARSVDANGPAAAAVAGPAPAGPDLPPGATEAWWAAAQAYIRADAGHISPDSAAAPTGLSPTPDWTADGENDYNGFGGSVVPAGDLNGDGFADLAVGAAGYGNGRGKAYVFHGSAAGLSPTPDWTAEGENEGDNFGSSIAPAGDVNGDGFADLAVGIYGYEYEPGKAYVFHGSADGLNPAPAWTADGENDYDHFGFAVASAGDVNGDGYTDLAVGAVGYPNGHWRGKAYVYYGSAAGLGPTPDWTADGESEDDVLSTSVAPAGDVNGDGFADLAVGARGYEGWQGKAYVYHGSAAGLSPTPDWTAEGENFGDYFGCAMASAGDVNGDGFADLAVGADGYGEDQGRAYVFHGSAAGLSPTPAWMAEGEGSYDYFGGTVASAGDVNGDGFADLAAGADGYGEDQGKAYVFHGSAAGLSLIPDWMAEGENDSDRFGWSVASAGDVNGDGFADLAVGASGYASWQGKAYVYHGAGGTLGASDDWIRSGENTGDRFGWSVTTAGDVDGDGFADLAVGAVAYDNNRGRVYVYHGSAAGLSAFPAWTASGENAGDGFGSSVASAGDVNGDGFADLAVGAFWYPGGSWQGKAYVFHGAAAGLSPTPDWTAEGEGEGDYFGRAVASAGDVDGDGYADLAIGATGYGDWRGKAYVFHGSAASLGSIPAWTAEGEGEYDYFGRAVAAAGDVDGDGFADLAVGAWGYGSFQGRAYVFHGSAAGLSPTPTWTASGENDDDNFGISVASAGDVNGDSFADLAVGASGYPYVDGQGKAYVYHGAAAGLGSTPAWTASGENVGDYFGTSVASAGDVNGDSFADLAVGAPGYPGGNNQGQAYVFHGSPAGLGSTPAWTATGENDYDLFGQTVASAGDPNGDGYADLVVGADHYNGLRGKAYVYAGNGADSDGGGRVVLARQARGDGSGIPVQPWGLAHRPDRFEVQMWATDPLGRGRVRLQVQACPPGEAFGSPACVDYTAPAWTDVTATATGVQFAEIIPGLEVDTVYRWRARVLYAPFTVDQPGITAPPNPAHGPWRRFLAQALEADLRTTRQWEVYLPLVLRDYRP